MSPRLARAKFAPVEEFYGMAGIYNADPDVGLAYGAYSDQMQPAKLYEATLEISYSIQVLPGFSLQPGAQVLINPGGSPSTPGALALGLNAVVSF